LRFLNKFWDFEILRFWNFEILKFWDFEISLHWSKIFCMDMTARGSWNGSGSWRNGYGRCEDVKMLTLCESFFKFSTGNGI